MSINANHVMITGMGILSTHGLGMTAFTRALKTGKNPFQLNSSFPELSFPLITATLPDMQFNDALNFFTTLPTNLIDKAKKLGQRAPRTIQTSILSVLEAYQQAQLHTRNIPPEKIGIVIAGQNTTQAYQYDLLNRFQKTLDYLPPTYAFHFMDTDQVGSLSELLNIRGEGFTIGGASASGNMAMIQAMRLLSHENIDVCIVVGVLADLSPLELQGFYNIGAMGGKKFKDNPQHACRPFDKQHEGFIWGQASACLVLESPPSHYNNIPCLGYIAGAGICLDANTHPNPNSHGEMIAMQKAISSANYSLEDIDYINTHGSSSPLGDCTEIQAIQSLFSKNYQNIFLNSTKSITGHCLWSAGIVETIAILTQMQNNFLHPTLNLEEPIIEDGNFVKQTIENIKLHIALNNSFGFGGINTSLLIKSSHT